MSVPKLTQEGFLRRFVLEALLLNSSRDTETLPKIATFFISVIDKHAYYDQIKFSIVSGQRSILKKESFTTLFSIF